MKKYLLLFLKTYLLFILIFILEKPLFMLFYHDIYREVGLVDVLSVLYHGFQLDASMAGYLAVIPGLLLIFSLWVKPRIMKPIVSFYYILVSLLISVDFVVDLVLYRYWGFRLDSTPLFYLKSPKDALASANWTTNIFGLLFILLIARLLFYIFNRFLTIKSTTPTQPKQKLYIGLALLFCSALLFLPIRGGVGVSTMNVGKVYFSDRKELNHAAINPLFSFFEALTFESDFDKQYRFMKADEAKSIFATIVDKPASDTIPQLFTVKHPNVVFVVLESFMSKDMEVLGGLPNVAVRMNELSKEGILFTNFYANSFRTDRGLVSIFSGYPGQPNTSIMKYARKAQSLPSIPKSLKKGGYDLQYYYGGDADFTNMRSYLVGTGIIKIVSDQSFPPGDQSGKWGVPDHIVFNKLSADLDKDQKEPFMKILQTLSSHEPFDVPFHKLGNPYLNSVAYTDSCLGAFIDHFKKTKWWKNSIVVMVPDHAMHYPDNLDNRSDDRYKIPLLIVGGAVKTPRKIDTYGSQIDISATLLSQFKLPHDDFRFSKNILNPASPHFGYFTFKNGFGMVTPQNQYVFDYEAKAVFLNRGNKDENKKKAEALLQTLYDDLEKR
ncbi:MAG TPA: sulfatase-like hydrolase/transferase [Paludibacter sp.]|nr:sulfatase-like hydrolase/transferase [Paludibacter sp.]